MVALRDYQQAAVDALLRTWEGGVTRSAMIAATGSGKTVTFAGLINRLFEQKLVKKVLVLAHREELLEQTRKTIQAVAPHLSVGIVQGERNEVNRQVVIASVQTLSYRKPCRRKITDDQGRTKRCGQCTRCETLPRAQRLREVGAIVVDECHHSVAPTYRRIFTHFGVFMGHIPLFGFTATMSHEQGKLAQIFQKVPEEAKISLGWLISQGWLVKPHAQQVVVPGMDLDQAKVKAGDFTSESLAELMLENDAMGEVARAYAKFACDRPGLVFCPTVQIAQHMANAFNAESISAAVVWGAMSGEDRKATLKKFKNGDLQVLVNVMVLTEGYDEPKASCVVIARPTKSRGLYTQMVGRGMRTSVETGKEDLLILDVMGATTRHSLATLDDVTGAKSKDKEKKTAKPTPDDEEPDPDPEAEAMPVMKTPMQIIGWRAVELDGIDVHKPRRGDPRYLASPKGVVFVPTNEEKEEMVNGQVSTRKVKRVYFTVPSPNDTELVRLRCLTGTGVHPPEGDPDFIPGDTWQKINTQARKFMGPWDDAGAAWRKRKPASPKQQAFAAKVVREPTGDLNNYTKGEVGDLIDTWTIGREIDDYVAQYLKAKGMEET